MKEKEIVLEINGRDYTVVVNSFSAEEAQVTVDGKHYTVGLKDLGVEKVAEVKPVAAAQPAAPKKAAPAAQSHRPQSLGSTNAITAPLPGQITRIFIKEGDTITAGQKVCMLEAMKMENEVNASIGGVVIDIRYQEGESVNQGDALFLLKPSEN